MPNEKKSAPEFTWVGSGYCLICDEAGNLYRRKDQRDGDLFCHRCSVAYRVGWNAAMSNPAPFPS